MPADPQPSPPPYRLSRKPGSAEWPIPGTRPRFAENGPIGSYALIGDTRTTALVGADGSVDWLCLPNMSDPSIFAAMLDAEHGGRLSIRLTGPMTVSRHYEGPSAVLRTRMEGDDGVVWVTDAMTIPRYGKAHGIEPARRLVRLVEVERGTPEVEIVYEPRPDYGRTVPKIRSRGSLGWTLDVGDFVLFQTDMPVAPSGPASLAGRERLAVGARRTVSLSFSRNEVGVFPQLGEAAVAACADTTHWWYSFADRINYRGPFKEAVVRSLLTLRLLNFSHSGAVIAAATTSLPEAMGGARNWDYRYCWLRDATFILRSFLALDLLDEGEAFFRWLMHATQLTAPRLSVLYDVFGRTDLSERQIETLRGHCGSAPVRIGNGAKDQLQLDVYGSVLTAALHYVRRGGFLGRAEQGRLQRLGGVVMQSWKEPDNGIWEQRGERRQHTYSKAMCFAALDALVELGRMKALPGDTSRFAEARDEIRDAVLSNGWSDRRQSFVGAFGEDALDAALLLLPRTGIVAADDPRMVATFERIEAELGRGARIYRYAPASDGMPSREGTFTACGFWAAEVLAQRGEVEAARARIASLLEDANDLLLMSEETDPETGRQLGNFPQAFSHTGLVNAALTLRDAEAGERQETPQ